MRVLDYEPPPDTSPAFSWRAFALRTVAFVAVFLVGWAGQRQIAESRSEWALIPFALWFVVWMFSLVRIAGGGWALGALLGFICSAGVAGPCGAILAAGLGAIVGAAAKRSKARRA